MTPPASRSEIDAQRLALIIESSDDAIVSKDLNGVITSWNRGAELLFGYSAAEAVGMPVAMLIPSDREDEEPGILARIRRGERIDHYETVRRRKDGSLVDISLSVSPIKLMDGKIIGASKIARDITERNRAAAQRSLLLNEMKHRVKNTLATVQAIARQTLQSASQEDRDMFLARLQSLASAHDLLTIERWNRASVRDLAVAALAPFRGGYRERVLIDVPAEALLDADSSLLLTMVLHELATNAVKYGALSNDTGKVRLYSESLSGQPNRLRLTWQESGGPAVCEPKRKGFGSRLIEHTFAGEQGGVHCRFAPQGVECSLELATLGDEGFAADRAESAALA